MEQIGRSSSPSGTSRQSSCCGPPGRWTASARPENTGNGLLGGGWRKRHCIYCLYSSGRVPAGFLEISAPLRDFFGVLSTNNTQTDPSIGTDSLSEQQYASQQDTRLNSLASGLVLTVSRTRGRNLARGALFCHAVPRRRGCDQCCRGAAENRPEIVKKS